MSSPSIKERFEGLTGYAIGTTQGAVEVPFLIEGFTDEFQASAYALANSPSTRGTYFKEQIARLEALNADAGQFYVWVRYVANQVTAVAASGLNGFQFSTKGGSLHIRQSIQTSGTYIGDVPGGTSTVNHNQAIGVTPEGNVEGVDIDRAQFEWTETWRFPLKDLIIVTGRTIEATDLMSALFTLTDTVNESDFRFCNAGEARFLGAEGSVQNLLSGDPASVFIDINFTFAASQNRDDINLPGVNDQIVKDGWEYLWVEYSQVADSNSSRMGNKIVQANVDQVYYVAEFDQLQIGD